MGGRFSKKKVDDQKKWFHPLAAMLLSYDVVVNTLKVCYSSTDREIAFSAFKSAGTFVFNRVTETNHDELLRKIRDNGVYHGFSNIYNSIRNDCFRVPIDNRVKFIWKETLRASLAIDNIIYTDRADKFNFDEKKIPALLDYADGLCSVLPSARGYFLYSVGEALISSPESNLLHRWYEILEKKHADLLPIIIIPKLTPRLITIDIPIVLIEIIISFSNWELQLRRKVMMELSQL
ncbi:MAG: hypothetical protein Harvfovirus31_3 [Harvfovirus sp.]|uniref:Uncharacterized protein n=1 Tax=Harvfovirus sp. TaxID=2487768 RepID=A0A3G5A2D1_9VIRU|nr:MAG: hypothetical protein Harvfovirus31_3 [Harvfovirus sp.]